ncbi:alpha/beta hydrolase family protein [Spirillospora sp. NBC_00431]
MAATEQVSEPEGPLWPPVKARTGWPEPDEARLGHLAEEWAKAGAEFDATARYDVGHLTDQWPDDTGGAFQARVRATLGRAATTAGGMTALATRTETFATEVQQLKQAIRGYIEANTEVYVSAATMPGGGAAFQADFVDQVAAQVNAMIADTAERVAGDDGVSVPPPPPGGASPRANADYWKGLTEAQKLHLSRENPEWVGNANGVPAHYRDIANRTLLARERDLLESEAATLRDRIANVKGPGASVTKYALEADLAKVEGKLSGIREIEGRLASTDGDTTTPESPNGADGRYYLLGISGKNDGRAIVARGNPDTADHVATFVPGMYSDLATYRGQLDWSQSMHAAADTDQTSTSVITWLGYDAPDDAEVISTQQAEEGAPALRDFQEGLRQSQSGDPAHQTVVAHSYGGVVAGTAARDMEDGQSLADDLVSLGAPGLGSGVGHADDLHVPEGHVWTTESQHDAVGDTAGLTGPITPLPAPIHGADPTEPRFGARTFNADAEPGGINRYWETLHHHNGYFNGPPEDNPALRTTGDIIAGRTPEQQEPN